MFEQAHQGGFALWKLNFVLLRGIPFNLPHRFKIVDLKPRKARVFIPFIRKNKNHLKGLHACCLATAAEYTSGLVMLGSLNPKNYRLIMRSIQVDYLYQGRMPCYAEYSLSEETLKEEILDAIATKGQVDYTCEVEVKDTDMNSICVAKIDWQIKNWNKVSSKSE